MKRDLKVSAKMKKGIERIVKPWTADLSVCDGRDLSGVAITLDYKNEAEKEFNPRFWDFCEITIQDVRWDGTRNRHERDVFFVRHNGEISKF